MDVPLIGGPRDGGVDKSFEREPKDETAYLIRSHADHTVVHEYRFKKKRHRFEFLKSFRVVPKTPE